MKICAITMVYRDHWALSQWYGHFAPLLGERHLYIVAHGPDPEISRLCPEASIITIPRDRLDRFDAVRERMLNGFQSALTEIYDWVIRTDVDELICLDPSRHRSLADLLGAQETDAVFALGLNVAEHEDDTPLPEGAPALAFRKAAAFSGHYSKAWAVRGKIALMRHGVAVRKRHAMEFPFCLPRGVYLAHLKFADRAALAASNAHRREIAGGTGTGLPGRAWRDPEQEARRFYRHFSALPLADWAKAEDTAWTEVSTAPVRDAGKGLVRARNIRFDHRTTLPDWFGQV